MKTSSLAYTRYWQNSLTDAVLNHGGLQTGEIAQFSELTLQALQTGQIEADLVKLYFDKQSKSKKLPVILRPFVYRKTTESSRSVQSAYPAIITPIVTCAFLTHAGKLYPVKTTFARDLLEPIDHEGYTIGQAQDAYAFIKANPIPAIMPPSAKHTELDEASYLNEWKNYTAACELFLNTLCHDWLKGMNGYKSIGYGYIHKTESCLRQHKHIYALYDHLCTTLVNVPLYDDYANEYVAPLKEQIPNATTLSQRLAHTNRYQALTEEERTILSHTVQDTGPEILAVNTPPAIQTTELLRSTIATFWAQAALDETPAPVIFVTSANQRSLKILIEAFDKKQIHAGGPFAGRWIPDVRSFSAYFPSTNYGLSDVNYQASEFFEYIETAEFFQNAKKQYLTLAKAALPEVKSMSVSETVEALQYRICNEARKLKALESAWRALCDADQQVDIQLGNEPAQTLESYQKILDKAIAEKELCTTLVNQWELHKKTIRIFFRTCFAGSLLFPKNA